MKIKKLRESNEINSAMELMLENEYIQDDPYIGCFWWDIKNSELFGVDKTIHSDVPYYHSAQFNCDIRTGRALHKNIWKRESFRKKDKRFSGDYTKVPRGRVFEFKDKGFKVFCGDWINNYPNAKDEIFIEFQLPEDNTEIIIDSHWDIGHGWTDDYM